MSVQRRFGRAPFGFLTQGFEGLSEGLSEPGKGGGCTRAPGSGGGRLAALAFGGLFDGLGRTLGLGEGGSERFGELGRGGPLFERAGVFSVPARVTLADWGREGLGDFAGTGSPPATIDGGRRVAAMFAPRGSLARLRVLALECQRLPLRARASCGDRRKQGDDVAQCPCHT